MSQGQVSGSDNAVGWIILLVIFVCLAFLIWYMAEFEIKSIIRWIRWSQMWIVSWFVGPDYTVMVDGRVVNFQQAVEQIPEIPYNQLNDPVMHQINTVAMTPMRWVYGAILAFFAYWALFRGPETYYRRKMGLDALINAQAPNFPVIKPFTKFNPSNQPFRPPGARVPADLPLFAEALGPEEWLAFNQIPVPDGEIDEEAARAAFIKQLGAPWRGAHNLPDYKKILLAAFCLKAARKRGESDELLSKIAACWDSEKGLQIPSKLVSEANRVLKNKELSGKALSKANRHAFQTTAMMRALQAGRSEGGVLAPAQFVWLRGYDRDLWYPLNNLGRNTYHMEAIGAIAHFKQEKITDRPIPRPKVDDAVKTITDYMIGSTSRPIPQLDYSKSKKGRGIKKPKTKSGLKKPKAPAKKSA